MQLLEKDLFKLGVDALARLFESREPERALVVGFRLRNGFSLIQKTNYNFLEDFSPDIHGAIDAVTGFGPIDFSRQFRQSTFPRFRQTRFVVGLRSVPR